MNLKCKDLDGKQVLLLTVQFVSVCFDHANTLSIGTEGTDSFFLGLVQHLVHYKIGTLKQIGTAHMRN